MAPNSFRSSPTYITAEDRKRRRREIFIIVFILLVVAALTVLEIRLIHFEAEFPISNTILMFILININLLLLILLIFLVFRNLVKLLYDRRRRVMGAKLRTRLVVAFVALTLMPSIVLFFFSINFITTSIEFWFNVPVEQALENSLEVGRKLYDRSEANSRFFLKQMGYQIDKKHLMQRAKRDELARYIQIVQRSFNLNAVEIYTANAERLFASTDAEVQIHGLPPLTADQLRQDPGDKMVRSVFESRTEMELVRTIATVPFGAQVQDANAFSVITVLIPIELSENMDAITRGADEYQQVKLLKNPIQSTYYITLSIVALLVVFCAIWFGFYFAKSISIPIKDLAEGTRRVAEGDLGFKIAPVADDEIGSLVDSFNKMTQDLRTGREQLELSSQILRRQNTEIEDRRRYMEIVLENISAGVISIDAMGVIRTINKSAEKMLQIEPGDVLDQSYRNLLTGSYLKLAEEVTEDLAESKSEQVEFPFRLTVGGRPRSFMLHINALKNEAGDPVGIVVVFDDLTALEKAQRMAAWREVARRIAHEVKNPLTPIALSAQRLKRRYSGKLNELVFDECTTMIIDHVELIRNLVNEFSTFARFPTANPKPCDLPPIIEETVVLYKEGHPDISFAINIAEDIPRLNLDRQQIKQALINLIDNAVAALKGKGSIVISVTNDPILKRVRLEFADNGSGISDEDKTRLFEPNFSTKKAGMGLGLTIVSSIVTDHHGMIRVQDNHPQGAKFIVELPV
jgi:two-component system, NtrC family, nitrogen regulation sensor histidine kinase NtrY